MNSTFKMLKANEQADLTETTNTITSIGFTNNALRNLDTKQSYQKVLRLIADKKMGISVATKVGMESELVEDARQGARYGSPIDYTLPGPTKLGSPKIYDQEVTSLALPEMLNWGQSFVERGLKHHKDIQTTIIFKREEKHFSLCNTEGFSASYGSTYLSVLLGLNLTKEKNFIDTFDFHISTHLDLLPLEDIIKGLFTFFDLARINVKVPAGNYQVLFTPSIVANIMSPILACLNGQAIVQGLSPWQNKLGSLIFNKDITIINDGLLDKGVGSKPFDIEGVACQTFPLFEKGYLKNFLLDLATSQKLGLPPNGTGGSKRPQDNNFILEPGSSRHEDILANMERGILIAGTMGTWAGNPYNGQVSGNISLGYLIEDGKIKGRIKDAMFTINIFQALREQIKLISADRKWVNNKYLPYILFNDVSISL